MATRGNKRVPDNVHLLKGTHNKSRHGDPKKKPVFTGKVGDPPAWLSTAGKTEWARIVPILEGARVLTSADQTVLVQYCQLWSQLATDAEAFTAAQHTQLRMCCIELGLTPSARSKIVVEKSPESGAFDEF